MIHTIAKIADNIKQAEAIIIGAGAGLSAAAGLDYTSADFFTAAFPGYHDRYSLQTINEADFYQFPTAEEQYAWWTRLISVIRHNPPAGKPYRDLLRIVKDKPHFVLTTNTDGQFLKAGFKPENILAPQGDLAFFQCTNTCTDTIYPNKEMIQKIFASLTPRNFVIQSEDIPRCPNCGSPLIPNVRKDKNFVEEPWIGQYQKLIDFINAREGKNILMLELGVGTNTPGIIRYPFEFFTLQRNKTHLIRINLHTNDITLLAKLKKRTGSKTRFRDNSEKADIIQADIGPLLAELAEEY